MALLDILELGELLLSWRLYLGLALTALLCWGIVHVVPSEALQWIICIPLGFIGLILSVRWQVRADFDR